MPWFLHDGVTGLARVQAFGACVGPCYREPSFAIYMVGLRRLKMLSTLAIVMAIAPIAGPLFAGHLLVCMAFIFWFGYYRCFNAVSRIIVPETHP